MIRPTRPTRPTRPSIRHAMSGRRRAVPLRDDAGLTTVEYAVGTVAVAGLGGLLLSLLTSDWMRGLVQQVVEFGIGTVTGR